MFSMFIVTLLPFVAAVADADWTETGYGSIIFEEAVSVPNITPNANSPPPGVTQAQLVANLVDIHNQPLAYMNAAGVDYMVLSCVSPCIQGLSDPVLAETGATDANNYLTNLISNNTAARFGAFATLSIHDDTNAGSEIRRAVTELGFLGALINDYQQSGPDNGEYPEPVADSLSGDTEKNYSDLTLLRPAPIGPVLGCSAGAECTCIFVPKTSRCAGIDS